MRTRLVRSFIALLAGAGLSLAAEPATPSPNPPDAPKVVSDPNSVLPDAVDAPVPNVSYGCGDESPCPSQRFWVSGEYLLWWFKNSPEPAPIASTGPLVPGGGVVTFGGRDIDTGAHSGARFTLGAWLDDDDAVGAEASYFFLATKSATLGHQLTAGEGTPAIDPVLGPVFTPFGVGPDLTVHENLSIRQFLQGYEVNGVVNTTRSDGLCVDLVGGFRYLDLSEDLGVGRQAVDTLANFTDSVLRDINTRNQFYGGDLGVRVEDHSGAWSVNAAAKVALGDMHERLSYNGGNDTFNGVVQAVIPVVSHRDRFAVVPEGSVGLGYEINDHWRATVAYDFLYVSSVVRPGAQLNPVLVNQPTGANSDFWAQGVNFGLAFGW